MRVRLKLTHVLNHDLSTSDYISQGNAGTHFWCDVICKDHVIANLLQRKH